MDDSIIRVDDCIFSLSRYDFSDFIFDVIMSFESEKHRFGVSILRIDQTSSIFKLFLQSEFVLLNKIFLVVLNASESKDTMLYVVSHLHLVDVDSFLLILFDILFFNELLESVITLLVDFLWVRVLFLWHCDFRLHNVQEAHWISFSH